MGFVPLRGVKILEALYNRWSPRPVRTIIQGFFRVVACYYLGVLILFSYSKEAIMVLKLEKGKKIDAKCRVCGSDLYYKGGRVPECCGDVCRDIVKYKDVLLNRLLRVKLMGESRRMMKSELFNMANML